MHLLITGGTGFAGQALIRYLRDREPGAALTVISRSASELPGVAHVITGHFGDLARSPDFPGTLAGFDAVIHLGDGLSILQDERRAGTAAALIEATERLAHAIREARVPLLVHVSSIKALCDEEDDRLLVETSQSRATTAYGLGKLRLEQALAGVLEGSATRHVTVRNPVMYGASKSGSLLRLLQLADSPYPLPLGGLANRRSVLSVHNLASALHALLRAEGAPAGVLHVHDGPALSTTDIVETMRRGLGRPRRLLPGHMIGLVTRRLPILASTARRLYGSLEMSDARFRGLVPWAPVEDTRVALAAMADSYARTGKFIARPRSNRASAAR